MSDDKIVPAPALPQDDGADVFFGGHSVSWFRNAKWFADACFNSRMLPPHIKTAEQAFFVLVKGDEIGLPPTAAWSFMFPTKSGNLGILKKGALAAVQSKATFGGYEERIEFEGTPNMRAVAIATRKGFPPTIKEFSLKDAETAGLLKKPRSRDTGKEYDGPWQSFLKDLLLARCGCRALNVAFAAELAGCLVEGEAQDADDMAERRGDVRVTTGGAAGALQGAAQRLLAPPPKRDPILDELRVPGRTTAPRAPAPEVLTAEPLPETGMDVVRAAMSGTREAFEKPAALQAIIDAQVDEVFGQPEKACPRCKAGLNAMGGCDVCGWPAELDFREETR